MDKLGSRNALDPFFLSFWVDIRTGFQATVVPRNGWVLALLRSVESHLRDSTASVKVRRRDVS